MGCLFFVVMHRHRINTHPSPATVVAGSSEAASNEGMREKYNTVSSVWMGDDASKLLQERSAGAGVEESGYMKFFGRKTAYNPTSPFLGMPGR